MYAHELEIHSITKRLGDLEKKTIEICENEKRTVMMNLGRVPMVEVTKAYFAMGHTGGRNDLCSRPGFN